MGNAMKPGWWAVDTLCRLLDRHERDVVCGDLVEARQSAWRACLDVAGLVVRRQAAVWLAWQPWCALLTLAVPIGFLLSVASRGFADSAAMKVSLYIQTGNWAYFAVPGWRRDVIAAATTMSISFAALAAWS